MSDIKALLLEAAAYIEYLGREADYHENGKPFVIANSLRAAAESLGEPVAWVPAELIRRECTGAMAFWEMNREDQVPVYLAPQPAGYVLVPVEPTEEMVQAGRDSTIRDEFKHIKNNYRRIYSAMLAAAENAL